MEYRITDDASREAVFGNAEQYISDVKESWMYMGTIVGGSFDGYDEFKHIETRSVTKVPTEFYYEKRLDDFVEYVIDFYSEEMCAFRREDVLHAMALAAFKGRYSEVPFEGDSSDRVFIAGLLMEIRKNEKNVPVETVPGLGKRYRYWVEFIDHDGIQQSLYLCGQSNEHIKAMMDGYDIVVIDNLEIPEKCYWAEEEVQS